MRDLPVVRCDHCHVLRANPSCREHRDHAAHDRRFAGVRRAARLRGMRGMRLRVMLVEAASRRVHQHQRLRALERRLQCGLRARYSVRRWRLAQPLMGRAARVRLA